MFFVDGDVIQFARATGETFRERQRAAAARADEVARLEAERAKRLAKRRQVPIPLSVVYGERALMSVRDAARKVIDAGGQIGRGELGELRITVPQTLTENPLDERAAWAEVGVAAEVLARVPMVVLAALDDVEGDASRRPRTLVERLPDREPAFGGGVA